MKPLDCKGELNKCKIDIADYRQNGILRKLLTRLGKTIKKSNKSNQRKIYSSNDFRTKTGKKRIIPIHSAIRNELEKLPRKSEYVFLGLKGEPYNIRFFNKRFKIIVNYLNVPWVRVHDLRHSLASYLAEKGISYTTIAAILGHKSIATTLKFYQHTSPPELKTAIDLIPNFEVY